MSDEFRTGFYSDKACAIFEMLIAFGKNYIARKHLNWSKGITRSFANTYISRNPDNEIVLKPIHQWRWSYISTHNDADCRSYFAWRLNDIWKTANCNACLDDNMTEPQLIGYARGLAKANRQTIRYEDCNGNNVNPNALLNPNECLAKDIDIKISAQALKLVVDIMLCKQRNITRAIRKFGKAFYEDLVGIPYDPFTSEQETARRETIDKINGKLRAAITELESKKRDEYTKFTSELEAKYKVLIAEARISAENEIRQLNADILDAINAAKEEAAKIAEGSTDKAAEDLAPVTSLSIDF